MITVLSDILQKIPPQDDTINYRSKNQSLFQQSNRTCIIIDDDPTGNQTVYDIPLLAKWEVTALTEEFSKKTPAFFLLTNSRSLPPVEVKKLYSEIASNIKEASYITQRKYTIISRSDSTLRGHFPLETDTLKSKLGLKDAVTFLIPMMFEGERITWNDTHYILQGDILNPVHMSPFAKDPSFGYTQSNLKKWIQEKTKGKVKANQITSFSLEEIRSLDSSSLSKQIVSLPKESYCIINAICYEDLNKMTQALLLAEKSGKSLFYRTSSSFITSYLGLPEKKLLAAKEIIQKDPNTGGIIIVGSYVPKSSSQLQYLLSHFSEKNSFEIDVERILTDHADAYLIQISNEIDKRITSGADVLIYTSRKLVTGTDIQENLDIGAKVSCALIYIIQQMTCLPKYCLAKGGITSHDIATKGLGMVRSTVLGQILPGIPVWRMGANTKWPDLPYIVFPGNVGDEKSLYTITQKLSL